MNRPETRLSERCRPAYLAGFATLAICFLAASSALAGGVSHPNLIKRNTCSASDYGAVWVTVSDVQAHMGKSGWVDLTPALATAPMQVNLLDATSTDCFLASLGYTSGLPVGRYQQIRIMLWDNVGPGKGRGKGNGKGKGGGSVTPPATNNCSSVGTYDCVQLADGSFDPLFVNAETHTGLRIPPGQIARGGLDVTTGEVLDLDLDFDVCSSVVEAGHSGKFMLKPVLNHGEADVSPLLNGTVDVGTNNSGTITSNANLPVPGANVYLESQTPANGVTIYPPTTPTTAPVENLVATTTTFADGGFAFCAPAVGTYEIVSDADPMPNDTNASNATITTAVDMTLEGATAGTIPLLDDSTSAALLESTFTTANTTTPPGAGDLITFGGTQPFTNASSVSVQAVVPPLAGTLPMLANGAALPVVATASSPAVEDCPNITPAPTCPTGTNCACFTLALPNSNPVIGAAGGTYAAPAANPPAYSVVGAASQLNGSGTAECDPSALITNPAVPIALATNPFFPPPPLLAFTGCD